MAQKPQYVWPAIWNILHRTYVSIVKSTTDYFKVGFFTDPLKQNNTGSHSNSTLINFNIILTSCFEYGDKILKTVSKHSEYNYEPA